MQIEIEFGTNEVSEGHAAKCRSVWACGQRERDTLRRVIYTDIIRSPSEAGSERDTEAISRLSEKSNADISLY
jgi:hypothetical protein